MLYGFLIKFLIRNLYKINFLIRFRLQPVNRNRKKVDNRLCNHNHDENIP